MAIHHDKLAYGKIDTCNQDLTDEQIIKMLEELNTDEKNGENEQKIADKSANAENNNK